MSINYQKNTKSSIKGLEVQVGKIGKQLVDNHKTTFNADTKDNPKEHCNALATKEAELNIDKKVKEDLTDLDSLVEYFFGERIIEICFVLEDEVL